MSSERGKRLIPSLIDQIAKDVPDRVFASLALDTAFGNVQDITFQRLARAIDRCAWWIKEHFCLSEAFGTICFLGRPSLANWILIIGAIKTGHQLLLFDHTSSKQSCKILFEATKCRILLTEEDPLPAVLELKAKGNLRSAVVPDIQHWLQKGHVEPFAYTKSFSQARLDPFLVLTTSGSTGLPKPIVVRHGTITPQDLYSSESLPNGPRMSLSQFDGHRMLLGASMCHSAGLLMLGYCIYSQTVPVLPPPGPVTAKIANAGHARGRVTSSWLLPMTWTEIVQYPEYLENLRGLQHISYGGMAVPESVGDTLAKYAHLHTSFGSSETGYYALEVTDPEDWKYIRPSPLMGAVLREVETDAFQLVFERSKAADLWQGIFATYPDLQEYDTKDIYKKHPSKEGVWLYQGRAGLLVVLLSTAQINPLPYEAEIDANPLVRGSLYCGFGRPVPALLVEAKAPPSTAQERAKLVEAVWPTVERANARLKDGFGQIEKQLIVVTASSKPMFRSEKGSIQRKKTLDLYSQEIDEAYSSWEAQRGNTYDGIQQYG